MPHGLTSLPVCPRIRRSISAVALQILAAFAVVLSGSAAGSAAPYPERPIQIITQAAAGSGPDVIGRIVAEQLGQLWQQHVVIINRPGADGFIAAQAAIAAPPDGYTLYLPNGSTFFSLPATHDQLPFNLQRDLTPIGMIGVLPMVVAASRTIGVTNLGDLLAFAKAHNGELFYAGGLRGGLPDLVGAMLNARLGINLTYVHYVGTAKALPDVIAGRVPLVVDGIAALSGAMGDGLIAPLAVASVNRLPDYPNLPTVAETIPDFEAVGWFPLMAPAGLPADIQTKLNGDLNRALARPALQSRLAKLGTYVRQMSPAELSAFIHAQQDLWEPIAHRAYPHAR
jgi:tripartite-type tricarboxylate transporter receptor subunit TctC